MKTNNILFVHTIYIKNIDCYINIFVQNISNKLYYSITCYNAKLNTITQKKLNKIIISNFYKRNNKYKDLYLTVSNYNLRFSFIKKSNSFLLNYASPNLIIDDNNIGFDSELKIKLNESALIKENLYYVINHKSKGITKTHIKNKSTIEFEKLLISNINKEIVHYFEIINKDINFFIIDKYG